MPTTCLRRRIVDIWGTRGATGRGRPPLPPQPCQIWPIWGLVQNFQKFNPTIHPVTTPQWTCTPSVSPSVTPCQKTFKSSTRPCIFPIDRHQGPAHSLSRPPAAPPRRDLAVLPTLSPKHIAFSRSPREPTAPSRTSPNYARSEPGAMSQRPAVGPPRPPASPTVRPPSLAVPHHTAPPLGHHHQVRVTPPQPRPLPPYQRGVPCPSPSLTAAPPTSSGTPLYRRHVLGPDRRHPPNLDVKHCTVRTRPRVTSTRNHLGHTWLRYRTNIGPISDIHWTNIGPHQVQNRTYIGPTLGLSASWGSIQPYLMCPTTSLRSSAHHTESNTAQGWGSVPPYPSSVHHTVHPVSSHRTSRSSCPVPSTIRLCSSTFVHHTSAFVHHRAKSTICPPPYRTSPRQTSHCRLGESRSVLCTFINPTRPTSSRFVLFRPVPSHPIPYHPPGQPLRASKPRGTPPQPSNV